VEIVRASPLIDNRIIVVRNKKEVTPMTSYGKSTRILVISQAKQILKPGDKTAASFAINRFFEMTNNGVYEITVSRPVLINETERSAITAPPIEIHLKKD
jgi:hypothetical protein